MLRFWRHDIYHNDIQHATLNNVSLSETLLRGNFLSILTFSRKTLIRKAFGMMILIKTTHGVNNTQCNDTHQNDIQLNDAQRKG